MHEKINDAKKIQISCFIRTELCKDHDVDAIKNEFRVRGESAHFIYFSRPYFLDKEAGIKSAFNLFPIVINADGSPWCLANLYTLDGFEKGERLDSLVNKAEDIGVFNAWLNQAPKPDEYLTQFPSPQVARVTYRFHAFLKGEIRAENLEVSTGNRIMLHVLDFYRWLIKKGFFAPENPICEEQDLIVSYRNSMGFQLQKSTRSTDLSINTPQSSNPYDGTIMDEEKLRPLTELEQTWVFEAAKELGNTEVYLILLIIVATGARIQTACTLRRHHFTNPQPKIFRSIAGGHEEVRLMAGPRSLIDTKRSKNGLLMIPKSLYDLIHTYVLSERSKYRCKLTKLGIVDNQYLFLTKQGNPYFEGKDETEVFNPNLKRRHFKKGGTVRQFLKDTLIPKIQEHHGNKFRFKPHDLRATFGMNTEAILVSMVADGKLKKEQVRPILSALMWHKYSKTTELYLNYRSFANATAEAVDEYGSQIQLWIDEAQKGFLNER